MLHAYHFLNSPFLYRSSMCISGTFLHSQTPKVVTLGEMGGGRLIAVGPFIGVCLP